MIFEDLHMMWNVRSWFTKLMWKTVMQSGRISIHLWILISINTLNLPREQLHYLLLLTTFSLSLYRAWHIVGFLVNNILNKSKKKKNNYNTYREIGGKMVEWNLECNPCHRHTEITTNCWTTISKKNWNLPKQIASVLVTQSSNSL